jgi:hypothetical protein
MAFRTKKISQMDPKGANLASTDLLEISQLVSGSYVTKSITGAEIVAGATTGFVPTSRTLTINGTTQDLSADRTFTISTGITIGTTAITSGTVGRVLFEGTGNVVSESANLFWDNTNGRLGIGTSSPAYRIDVLGNVNGGIAINSKNASTGASATSGFQVQNSSTDGSLFITSTGYTPNGVLQPNTLGFYSNGIPITICSGNIITMSTGGVTERLRITSTGNVLISTTTDAGFKLDVNGTARVVGRATIQTLTVGLGNNSVANNTVVGLTALNVNTTGDYNSAFGGISLQKNTSGNYNTAIGYQTLNNNTSGANNTAIGMQSCNGVTIQSNNTGVGFQSLNSGGANNSALGASTDSGGFSGSVILGRSAVATGANQFVVGSTGTNAGSVTTEVNASTQVWNVIINGVARKILLA